MTYVDPRREHTAFQAEAFWLSSASNGRSAACSLVLMDQIQRVLVNHTLTNNMALVWFGFVSNILQPINGPGFPSFLQLFNLIADQVIGRVSRVHQASGPHGWTACCLLCSTKCVCLGSFVSTRSCPSTGVGPSFLPLLGWRPSLVQSMQGGLSVQEVQAFSFSPRQVARIVSISGVR